jgi:hypothetical protein
MVKFGGYDLAGATGGMQVLQTIDDQSWAVESNFI